MVDETKGWADVRRSPNRRNYRLLVADQVASLIGSWTRALAQDWLVYRAFGGEHGGRHRARRDERRAKRAGTRLTPFEAGTQVAIDVHGRAGALSQAS